MRAGARVSPHRDTAPILAPAADRPGAGAEHEAHAVADVAVNSQAPRPIGARAPTVRKPAPAPVSPARGRPLPAPERAHFESRLGQDLSGVRVHDDAHAAALGRAIGARAFARGDDIYFAEGQFRPGTTDGRRLIAHEIAHTLQPRPPDPARAPIQCDNGREVNPEIAGLPGTRFVDAYTEVAYDLDYRAVGGNLSTWLTVSYADDAEIDIGVYDIQDRAVDQLDSMANGHVGAQGRIFPRELTRTTVPRLWAARQEAISIMEQYNYEFMVAALPAVLFIIFMGGTATPAGGGGVRRTTRPRPPRRTPTPTATPGAGTAARGTAAPGSGAAAAATASFRLLSPRVLRYSGRDIVVVQTSRGAQAFYRRTGLGGQSAGAQAGEWAPFDGILARWFHKSRHASGSAEGALHRFGNEEFRSVSEWLGRQGIRHGDDVGEVFSIVNNFLEEFGALRLGAP